MWGVFLNWGIFEMADFWNMFFFSNDVFLDFTPFRNLKLHFPPLLCQIRREICKNGHFGRISWLIWYTEGEKCSFRLQKVVKSKNMFSKIKTRGDHLFNALSIAFIRQLEPKIDTLRKCGTGLLYSPLKKLSNIQGRTTRRNENIIGKVEIS